MPWRDRFKTNEDYNKWYSDYRAKNRVKLRKYNKKYNQLWRKKNGYHNEENSKKRYPEKEYARKITTLALRYNRLKRLPCEKCGSERSQAHHDDYTKPLEIRWLCPLHHKEFHMKLTLLNKNV